MSKYMTKQRKALLASLSAHADVELTAKQMEQALSEQGISISAVYRNLAELEKEGKVRRSSKSGSREVYYLYTDGSECRDCLHLSCEKCGKTYHMSMEGAKTLIDALAQSDEFTVDKSNTVLYGVCKSCKKKA